MVVAKGLDSQSLLDGLGQGVLIFDSANRLVMENLAVRTILGADLKLIRSEGWPAAAVLFNSRQSDPDKAIDTIRTRALESARPVRFTIYRSGEHVPCWASAVHGSGGEVFTMITLEVPDWSALTDLVSKYLDEVRDSVDATRGHADLIAQTLKRAKPTDGVEVLTRRISGFTRIIGIHMHRLGLLTEHMERLEAIRTGTLREAARLGRRKLVLQDFLEDFLEELDEQNLVDPETEASDHRTRIKRSVPSGLVVRASAYHLSRILRDLLRNALMYSIKATPIHITAHGGDQTVQIDVSDEGYGIRAAEADRVFTPFMRSRQPQVMGEFGYGLSLYLCKHEIEAMGGRIWFTSEEGVGTTFCLKLPVWRDDTTETSEAVAVQTGSTAASAS